MNIKIYAALFFVLVIGVSGTEPRKAWLKDPIPEVGFVDAATLEKWSLSSSLGGGETQKLTVAGEDIYWTARMVTSGVATTELVFWKKAKGQLMPCLIMPVRPGAYGAFSENGDVVIKRLAVRPEEAREVLRVKPDFFLAP